MLYFKRFFASKGSIQERFKKEKEDEGKYELKKSCIDDWAASKFCEEQNTKCTDTFDDMYSSEKKAVRVLVRVKLKTNMPVDHSTKHQRKILLD